MDEEKLGKDRSLGLVQIAASDYMKEADEGGYEVHDTKTQLSEGLRMGGAGDAKGTIQYTVSFFPTLNVMDPEEEEEERKAQAALEAPGGTVTPSHSKKSSVDARPSTEVARPSADLRKSLDKAGKLNGLANGTPSFKDSIASGMKQAPKVKITPEDLHKYGKSDENSNGSQLISSRIWPHCVQYCRRSFRAHRRAARSVDGRPRLPVLYLFQNQAEGPSFR
jgi:hypothetical protein